MAVSITTKKIMMQSFVFQGIESVVLDDFLSNARECDYDDGQLVYDIGELPESVYFVLQGAVKMVVPRPDGEDFFLGFAPMNTLFGEHEALCNVESAARISVVNDTRLIVIPRSNFIRIFENEPLFSQRLAKQLAMTMRMLIMAAAYHFNSSVDKKLASLLVHMSDRIGQDSSAGRQISVKLSQDEIARMLATTRQTVNKYLQHWRKQGWIAVNQGVIEILDLKAIEAMTDIDFLKSLR